GTYHLTCTGGDKVGNTQQQCPRTDITVISVADTAAPVFGDLHTTVTTIDVTRASATIPVTVHATDNLSGVSIVGFRLLPDSGPGYYGYPSLTSGTVTDGTWSGNVIVPQYAPAGTYHLTCTGGDKVGNTQQRCPSEPISVTNDSVDLTVALSASTPTVQPDGTLLMTATVANTSAATPVDPRVTIPVPFGTTLISLPPSCSRSDDGPVVCQIPAGDLAPGKSVTRSIELKVASGAVGSVSATATASSSSEERTPANNTATLSIPIVAPEVPDDPDPTDPPTGTPAKLSVTNTVSPAEALPGDTVTYALTATNGAGAGDATNTVVTDVLPAGVTFADASEGCTNTDGTVRCELGTIATGSSKTATIRATVDPIPMKADPNTAHQILEQKAETDLRVERGETKTATASCPTGYLATDGGIRLDAVDQGGDVTKTSVPASGPTADGSGWTATLRNDNPGAALAKVTVACLARTTVTGAHQHDLVTTTASAPAQPLAAGTSTVAVACPAGQTPFAPSYALSGAGVVTTSKESGSSWTFVVDSPAAGTGDFGVTCLGARTTTAAGHYHALGIDHRAQTITVPAGQTVETQLTCADEAKGIVASRRVDAGLVDRGTDPRAKIRSFRFTNPTDHALSADLGLTCVDIRTSGEPVSVRIANTAT
ncbi:DUF11 domain-containing protein, partial [Nocardioides sp.]|uniref:DUF11 domain-containing protein n=1 Tax=Nocardioides sp. TaxID=35761 RepID=UPI0025CC4D62